jgi:hypothetical protein
VDVLQAASYLSQPDAPFVALPPQQEDSEGRVYSGPGSRVTNDILRGLRQAGWPEQLVLKPGESQMLMNLPIPVKTLTPPLNGRSTFIRLRASERVYVASLALYARNDGAGAGGTGGNGERPPTLEEWQTLLKTGDLSTPRDRVPTPLDTPAGKIIYGRVAGVAQGSRWQAQVSDPKGRTDKLTIPQPGQAFSYGISTLVGGTLGTGQVQSAPMLVRYPDTAYQAHGNYTLEYNLSLPLTNSDRQPRTVALTFQTPVKFDQHSGATPELRFFNSPPSQVFFRGSLRLRYRDDQGTPVTRYIHLVQQRGQQGEPLVTLNLNPGELRLVQVDLLYPPDATPPQVLTIRTLR